MVQICFEGWREGFQKISFNDLLREYLPLSLSESKDIVDRVLSGEAVIVTLSSLEAANDLLIRARTLGAEGKLL